MQRPGSSPSSGAAERPVSPSPATSNHTAAPPQSAAKHPSSQSHCAPRSARFMLPPRTRFQLPFPSLLERGFAAFDDRVVALCQRRTDGLVHLVSMALTFFTSIEVSLVAPPTLYALGYDMAAGLCSSVLLVLGIVSQVPKKFIFRPRPWMVGRALPIRQDRTSSFPSRAVVCAVVFSWLMAQSLHLEGLLPHPLNPLKLWLAILAAASLTAFARINVGAHYPSDTILGFVLGVFVITCGSRLERRVWHRACPLSAAYATPHTASFTSYTQLPAATPPRIMAAMTLLAYAMTFVSVQGFWVKCSYVYGLLMACATFRASYLCPHEHARFAHLMENGSARQHLGALATFATLLLFGMFTRAKKGVFRIVSFSLIYVGTLLALIVWRLAVQRTALGHT
ncbi:unnamed protein product [Agarophyton chilense]|eukprot:gb/GEZJ01006114.1/.p1 GENE.gb/GEZJ01006114.1/~~gb/GEZJ01006114.1/.p1  ORF type:complete len:440 (+),score=47.64 gb/GEZJ01006114.1/:135-1322(+)